MKKKILKGIAISSIIIACMTQAFAVNGLMVDTGDKVPGSMDNTVRLYEQEIKNGKFTEEKLYQTVSTSQGFSVNAVAKFLDDGYLIQYAETLKSAGRLPSDYKVKGSQVTTQVPQETNTKLQIYAPVFNAEYYAKANTDVAKAVGTDPNALLNHFLTSGMHEGRQGSADFNLTVYMKKNADLVKVFGTNYETYYLHYITNGKVEGRVAK